MVAKQRRSQSIAVQGTERYVRILVGTQKEVIWAHGG
jgi:hypothetical protein